jgi:hypothetical protein
VKNSKPPQTLESEMAKRAPKAKTLKILDEKTMEYRFSYLYHVVFEMNNPSAPRHLVDVYAPNDETVMEIASRLFSGQGTFVRPLTFTKA